MEEDPGRVPKPNQQDTAAQVPGAPLGHLEHLLSERKLEEVVEENEDGVHWEVTGNAASVDACLLTLPSMPHSLCSNECSPLAVPADNVPDCRGGGSLDTDPPFSHCHLHPLYPVEEGNIGPFTELDLSKETGVPGSSSSCLDPSNDPEQGCGEEEPVTTSRGEEGSASGPQGDIKEVDPKVPPTELLAGESHGATERAGQETLTSSGGACKTARGAESPPLTASMQNSSPSTDGRSDQEHGHLDCHQQEHGLLDCHQEHGPLDCHHEHGPSDCHQEHGPLDCHQEQGVLDCHQEHGPSDCHQEHEPLDCHQEHGPLDCQQEHGPLDCHHEHGPLDCHQEHGPLDCHQEHGPLDCHQEHGPLDCQQEPGPSDCHHEHGPLDCHHEHGPLDCHQEHGPLDCHYEHGPLDCHQEHGPSDCHHEHGPLVCHQEHGFLDFHTELIEPAGATTLAGGSTMALNTPVCTVGPEAAVNPKENNEGCSLAIRTVVPPTQEGIEKGEVTASLVEEKEEEEGNKEEEEREEHNYFINNNICGQSIREHKALVEDVEEMDKETDLTEPCEQADQTLHLTQTEQSQREQLGQNEVPRQQEQPEHKDPLKPLEQEGEGEQPEQPDPFEQTNQTEQMEQPKQTEEPEQLKQTGEPGRLGPAGESASSQMEGPDDAGQAEQTSPPTRMLSQQTAQTEHRETNGGCADRKGACRLAERLYRLQDVRRTDVVKHLDKDNEFSRAVGEEYLKFFNFTGQNVDQGLRSFLKVVVLIGETQERERVLAHFSHRFYQCNPDSFSSPGAVLTLTCAVMLLNTDLHGQNVGKAMSMSSFVSNLDGMNEGENFQRDLLKGLYNTIKNDPLEWAVDEKELKSSMVLPGDEKANALPRSKSNPFQDVPHDKKASVYKQGFLTRKAHADIDGKRTPWGKRSWKTFYAVLKGMVLYLQKDEYRVEWQSLAEVVSVHHALAERPDDYTKRPHVFRLQTADWRVFLFQASTVEQMSSWIYRINLVSALYSSPPFPAAVGSQKRFSRPILPAVQSALTLEKQLQSHSCMLDSFSDDLALLQQPPPDGRRAKARELEERRQREEYLLHEKSRYEVYKQMLEVWKDLGGGVGDVVETVKLERFDEELCVDIGQEGGAVGLKKSHSSPSLNLELAPPPIVKVKRNISERRTYRKIIIPRRNREL